MRPSCRILWKWFYSCDINLKNVVKYWNDLLVEDDKLVGIVSNTHFDQSLKHVVKEVDGFAVDISALVKYLEEGHYFIHYVDTVDFLPLFTEEMLHVSVLPITHTTKDFHGKFDVAEIVKVDNFDCYFIKPGNQACML